MEAGGSHGHMSPEEHYRRMMSALSEQGSFEEQQQRLYQLASSMGLPGHGESTGSVFQSVCMCGHHHSYYEYLQYTPIHPVAGSISYTTKKIRLIKNIELLFLKFFSLF